jgi:hypothetical protein
MLAVFATLYEHWFSGPLAMQPVETMCESNWWTNLLYVNNLVFSDKQVGIPALTSFASLNKV